SWLASHETRVWTRARWRARITATGAVLRGSHRLGVMTRLPGGRGPVKRVCAALASGLILVALLPSTVSADRVSRYTDHYVWFDCSTAIDGGFAGFGGNTSEQFGDGAPSRTSGSNRRSRSRIRRPR